MFPTGVNTLLRSCIDVLTHRVEEDRHSRMAQLSPLPAMLEMLRLLWRTSSRKNAGPSFPTMFTIPQRERLHKHARHGSNIALAPWGMNKLRS
jgi:hypothetical protein